MTLRDRKLSNVLERDVDLLLLEEVQCNPRFAEWISDRSGLQDDYDLVGAWNSLVTADGESDLVIVFNEGVRTKQLPEFPTNHLALMIENKIDAAFQPDQANRYRRRGEAGIEEGQWSGYVTVLIAPKRYLETMTDEHVFDVTIPYEEIARELDSYGDARSKWRADVLRQAAKGRMAHSRPIVADEHVTRLMNELHRKITDNGFGLVLHPDKDWNVASASWYTFPRPSLPPGTSLDHRTAEGVVCLNVGRTRAEDVAKALTHLLPEGAMIEQRGMATIILFRVEPLDLTSTAEEQHDSYHEALCKALELRNWAAGCRPEFASIPRQN